MERRIDVREIIVSVFSVALKVVLFVIAAMFIYKYAAIAYDYGYRIFGEEPMATGEGRKVSVTVGTDMGVKDIGQMLENKGLIRDANLFVIQERLSEYHGTIEPGIYELTTAMTSDEMIEVMSSKPEGTEENDGNNEPDSSITDSSPLSDEEEYYIDPEDSGMESSGLVEEDAPADGATEGGE